MSQSVLSAPGQFSTAVEDCSECRYPWIPDMGDGTYRNPIICADYSDPDVIRHGDDFFLTASSFNCTPGLPILHSRDLVNWTIINHALKNVPHPRYEAVQHGCGVWAPSIRHHAGKFWIFFPLPDEGLYVVTAEHPGSRWSDPHLVQEGKGLIDPCPLWDDDGQAYLIYAYAKSRCGIKDRLRISPMAPDGSRLLGEGAIVIDGTLRNPTVEGPKFLKKDGWYYILAPAGGVGTGWQAAFRSRSIWGPYEENIVLAQGRTNINGPHQGALIDAVDGRWWFIHFQEALPLGRIVHLQPAIWKDGWPLMGTSCLESATPAVGEPVLRWPKPASKAPVPQATPATSDSFAGPSLGLQWQWQANHRDDWHSLTARPGFLRLFAQQVSGANLGEVPSLLLQKLPARKFVASVRVAMPPGSDARDRAGLAVVGNEHAALFVQNKNGNGELLYRRNGADCVVAQLKGTEVELAVEMGRDAECVFRYRGANGQWETAPGAVRAKEGHWIGAKVGIFCLTEAAASSGHADFCCFQFSPPARD